MLDRIVNRPGRHIASAARPLFLRSRRHPDKWARRRAVRGHRPGDKQTPPGSTPYVPPIDRIDETRVGNGRDTDHAPNPRQWAGRTAQRREPRRCDPRIQQEKETIMKLHRKITERRVLAACERRMTTLDNPGFCIACGARSTASSPTPASMFARRVASPPFTGARNSPLNSCNRRGRRRAGLSTASATASSSERSPTRSTPIGVQQEKENTCVSISHARSICPRPRR